MTQTDDARGRTTAEKLDELWEEFEASAKPTSFDGDMEFFNVEDMQDSAYYIYEAAKSLLAPTPHDARVDVEQAFMAAVWDALKADATDLRKQQRILSAFRADLAPTPQDDPRVTVLVEAARRAAALMERHGLSGGLVADLQSALAAFDKDATP